MASEEITRKFDRTEFSIELEELLLRYRPDVDPTAHSIEYHAAALEEALFGLRGRPEIGTSEEEQRE